MFSLSIFIYHIGFGQRDEQAVGTHFCYWHRAKEFARQRNAEVSASQGVTNPATDRSRALTSCVDRTIVR